MNFLKNMLGFGKPQLDTLIKEHKWVGTLYQVNSDQRDNLFDSAEITFERDTDSSALIHFHSLDVASKKKDYFFPITAETDLQVFSLSSNACFEWNLQKDAQTGKSLIVGCYFPEVNKADFKNIFCLLLKEANPKLSSNHLDYCNQATSIPVYGKPAQSTSTSKAASVTSNSSKSTNKKEVKDETQKDQEEAINDVLLKQIQMDETKLANTGSLFYIVGGVRKQIQQHVVFCIKNKGDFDFSIFVYNWQGYKLVDKRLTRELNYEINIPYSYMKWLDIGVDETKIVEVIFDKYDVAINIKFAMQECLYEMATKQNMKDVIKNQQELQYLKDMEIEEEKGPQLSSNVVKVYGNGEQIQLEEEKFKDYEEEVLPKDNEIVQKYADKRVMCQAKIADCTLVSLADQLEVLVIDEEKKLKKIEVNKLSDPKKNPIYPVKILMHDEDGKAMIAADDNKFYYLDMNEMKIVDSFTPSEKTIQDFCAEKKLAEIGKFASFIAVDEKNIYRMDPRIGKTGVAESKEYATNPLFAKLAVTRTGNMAIGSETGEIRLYKNEIGKNATAKYPGLGEPVRHLESTKDGKWLLATYSKYLILLPTSVDDKDLYEDRVKIEDRPKPIKLSIKLEHLQLCKVKNYELVPAKFDESKEANEKFIVSGFGEYVVIWTLSKIIKGKTDYIFSKSGDKISNAEFKFNDVNKLLMTTPHKVRLQESTFVKAEK